MKTVSLIKLRIHASNGRYGSALRARFACAMAILRTHAMHRKQLHMQLRPTYTSRQHRRVLASSTQFTDYDRPVRKENNVADEETHRFQSVSARHTTRMGTQPEHLRQRMGLSHHILFDRIGGYMAIVASCCHWRECEALLGDPSDEQKHAAQNSAQDRNLDGHCIGRSSRTDPL